MTGAVLVSIFQSPFNRVKECYSTATMSARTRIASFQSPFNRVKECYVLFQVAKPINKVFQSPFNRVKECFPRRVKYRSGVVLDSFSPLLIGSRNVTQFILEYGAEF